MRLVPVFFGLLTVGLVFPLRRYLGSLATLVGGALLAVSPGAVYVSRYFIHETLLVAFSLALVVALVFYLDRREAKYLLAAAVAAALLFATKETGIITVVVLLIATVVGHYYTAWRSPQATPGRAPNRRGARRQRRRSRSGSMASNTGPRRRASGPLRVRLRDGPARCGRASSPGSTWRAPRSSSWRSTSCSTRRSSRTSRRA